jgi:hypothetical protein
MTPEAQKSRIFANLNRLKLETASKAIRVDSLDGGMKRNELQ